jgi:hypothetical protein
MIAFDIAKEIVRIGVTAGLSKDVIALLEKKLAMLTDELVLALRKNSELEAENKQLHAQLENLKPVGFVENMGVFWKRTLTGFEVIPYCKECPTHPIMRPVHDFDILICGNGTHQAPMSVRPPQTD